MAVTSVWEREKGKRTGAGLDPVFGEPKSGGTYILDDYIAGQSIRRGSPWGTRQQDLSASQIGTTLTTAGNVGQAGTGLLALLGVSNPYAAGIFAALQIGGAIVGELFPSEEEQFQEEIMQRRRERSQQYARWEKGDFSPAEIADIERINEPMFDRLYDQMAARGIANTPAGQELLNEAYQNVFFNLQQQAQAALDGMDVNSWKMTSEMLATDPSFSQGFGELAKNYWTLQALDQLDGTDSKSKQTLDGVSGSMSDLEEMMKRMQMFKLFADMYS